MSGRRGSVPLGYTNETWFRWKELWMLRVVGREIIDDGRYYVGRLELLRKANMNANTMNAMLNRSKLFIVEKRGQVRLTAKGRKAYRDGEHLDLPGSNDDSPSLTAMPERLRDNVADYIPTEEEIAAACKEILVARGEFVPLENPNLD